MTVTSIHRVSASGLLRNGMKSITGGPNPMAPQLRGELEGHNLASFEKPPW
jgi:hypothetical protein